MVFSSLQMDHHTLKPTCYANWCRYLDPRKCTNNRCML